MARLWLLLACANALHVQHTPVHRLTAVGHAARPLARRASVPTAKLLSRRVLDFASNDAQHEFGMQGNILGFAPKGDAGLLMVLAFFVARTHRLPAADLAFALVYPLYLMLANVVRFDRCLERSRAEKRFQPLLREGRGTWFKRYILSYALVSLALPLPFVFLAPRAVAAAAAPHLFLTAVQSAVESLTAHQRFAPLLRLLVPIGFNVYRLGTLREWCLAAFCPVRATADPHPHPHPHPNANPNPDPDPDPSPSPNQARQTGPGAPLWAVAWAAGGLALALTNALLWSYNLFVFLLLRVAPQYLDPLQFGAPPVDWKFALLPLAPEGAPLPDDVPRGAPGPPGTSPSPPSSTVDATTSST